MTSGRLLQLGSRVLVKTNKVVIDFVSRTVRTSYRNVVWTLEFGVDVVVCIHSITVVVFVSVETFRYDALESLLCSIVELRLMLVRLRLRHMGIPVFKLVEVNVALL